MSLAYASQNGIIENRIVRYNGCTPSDGFLLGRSGRIDEAQWWALYNDGTHEEIKPADGRPRPTPDNAKRTKHVSIPPTLRGLAVPAYASQFTGGIRQVVQCEFSRGSDTKFSYTFAKSHGLLAFPFEHVSGSDKASEIAARKARKYFVVEISDDGVFAAPVEFGIDCCSAARVDRYMASRADLEAGAPPEAASQLSLAWYYAAKQGGRNAPVQRVVTAEAFQAMRQQCGGPWYPQMGWAFAYSGKTAANVLNRVTYENGYAYRTSLVRIKFEVKLAGAVGASIYRAGDIAIVSTTAPHDLIEGAIASIQGANEPEYNGARLAFDVTSFGFKFRLSGESAPSPATGAITVASLANGATVTGGIEIGAKGSVVFKFGGGGTLWYPESPGNWRGVYPSPDSRSGMDGPVHVFYDGEQEVVTRWRDSWTDEPDVHIYPPKGSYNWTGNAAGTHAYGDDENLVGTHVCQYPHLNNGVIDCIMYHPTPVLSGYGLRISAHKLSSHGFYGTGIDATVFGYNRFKGEAITTPGAILREDTSVYGNFYSLCPDCYYTDENGRLVTTGRSNIEQKDTFQIANWSKTEGTETAGGGSVAIMLYEEREAIVVFKTQGTTQSFQQESRSGYQRVKRSERKIDDNGSPFTDWESPTFQQFGFDWGPILPRIENVTRSGMVDIRAAGGFSQARTIGFDAQGNVTSHVYSPFLTFTRDDQTASSALFMMRGALYYPDPTLAPADQSRNLWYYLDDAEGTVLEGGFVNPGEYALVGFVGKV